MQLLTHQKEFKMLTLKDIYNFLILIRDQIQNENTDFICSCCLNTIDNLNSVIDYLKILI